MSDAVLLAQGEYSFELRLTSAGDLRRSVFLDDRRVSVMTTRMTPQLSRLFECAKVEFNDHVLKGVERLMLLSLRGAKRRLFGNISTYVTPQGRAAFLQS